MVGRSKRNGISRSIDKLPEIERCSIEYEINHSIIDNQKMNILLVSFGILTGRIKIKPKTPNPAILVIIVKIIH